MEQTATRIGDISHPKSTIRKFIFSLIKTRAWSEEALWDDCYNGELRNDSRIPVRLDRDFPMKDNQTLRLYARVARLGSFSAAAREAGLAQSQVSRMIAELEAGLGVRLLVRSTRVVVPTEVGLEFLGRIEPIIAALDDAENSVRETGELRGRLRLAMPTTMGTRVVIPLLPVFTQEHPRLNFEVMLDDAWQDMIKEAIDVGIRVGELPDGAGTSRSLGKMRRIVVASPCYLDKFGWPQDPVELSNHRIIGGPAAAQASSWRFEMNGREVNVDIRAQVSINDTEGALAAVSSGLGVTSTTSWACRRELENGTLVALFPSWKTAEIPVNAYFPAGRDTRLAAKKFVAFLASKLNARV
jgi:DNA-binding transcriptional LysR family regulator